MGKLPGVSESLMGLRTVFHLVCLLGLAWSLSGGAGAAWAEHKNVENKLKVAFLLNFAKFTSWPPLAFSKADAPFFICVPADDPFDGALNGLLKKQVGGRNIQICYAANQADGKDSCHLVYLSQAEAERQAQLLEAMKGKPVLTVSDIPGFAKAGGVIELRRQDNRLAFVVNNHAAQAAGLRLSSSFLQLAVEVL